MGVKLLLHLLIIEPQQQTTSLKIMLASIIVTLSLLRQKSSLAELQFVTVCEWWCERKTWNCLYYHPY